MPKGKFPAAHFQNTTIPARLPIYQTLFEKFPDCILVCNPDSNILDANQAACDLLDLPLETILKQTLSHFSIDGFQPLFKKVCTAFEAGEDFKQTWSLKRANDILQEIEITLIPNFLPEKHLIILRDITRQKLTEITYGEKQNNLQTMVDNSPDAIYLLDLKTHQITFNHQEFCGYSRAELESNRSILDSIHPEDSKLVQDHWQKIIQGEMSGKDTIEYRLRQKNGEYVWIISREIALERDKQGKPSQILVTLSNINARKQVELSLLESETQLRKGKEDLENIVSRRTAELRLANARLELELKERIKTEQSLSFQADLLDNVHDAIIACDAQVNITWWNRAAEEMFGWTEQETIGKNAIQLLRSELPERDTIIQNAFEAGYYVVEAVQYTKEGKRLWVESNTKIRKDSSGQLMGFIASVRDITEQKNKEEQISKLSHLYSVLSQVNEAIVRTRDISMLYHETCRIIAEAGFPLAWIGEVKGKQVVPQTWWGFAADYMKNIRVEIEGPFGSGPTGTSIRENRTVINDDFEINSQTAPWREAALKKGFHASAAFPLHRQGKVIGALTLYSYEPNAFNNDQCKLLESLAADISFALDANVLEHLRTQAENEVRENQKKYQRLVENINDLVCEIDQNGRFTYLNSQYQRWLGYRPQELLGTKVSLIGVPEQHELANQKLEELVKNKQHSLEIWRFRHKNGTLRWMECSGTVYEKPDGEIAIAVISRDITERKQMEDEIRHLSSFPQINPNPVLEISRDGQIIYTNPAVASLMARVDEIDPGLLLPHDIYELLANAGEKFEGQFQREVEIKGHFFAETIYFATEFNTARLYATNITERKAIEEALRQSERNISTLVKNIPDIIARFDTKLQLRFINQAVTNHLGLSPDSLIGKPYSEIYSSSQTGDLFSQSLLKVLETGEGMEIEQEYSTSFGIKYFQTSIVPEYGQNGQVESLLAISRDVTHRKQAEEEIKRLNTELEKRVIARTADLADANRLLEEKIIEEIQVQKSLQDLYTKYRIVADNNYDWEYWQGLDGGYLYNSPSCKRLTGYSTDQFLSNPNLLEQIILADDLPDWQKHKANEKLAIIDNQIEFRVTRADGSVGWIGHVCQPVFDDRHELNGTRGSNRDISGRKRAQLALQEALQFNQEIISSAGEGIVAYDLELNYVLWNPFMENLIGLPASEVLGKKSQEIFPYLQAQGIDQNMALALSGKTVITPDFQYQSPNSNKTGWISVTYAPNYDSHGKIIGIIGLVRDIYERKQAESEIRSHAERADALVRNAAHLNAQLDLEALLETVCLETTAALHAPAAWINLFDPGNNMFNFAHGYGLPPEFKEKYKGQPRAVYEQYITELGQIINIPDVQVLTGHVNQELFISLNMRSAVYASMLRDKQLIGVLAVISYQEIRSFTRDEINLLQGLADQAAQAIVNTRLFEQVSISHQRMRALSEALIEVQETERRNLALELHDELGQVLSAVKMSLDIIPNLPKKASDERIQRLQSMLGDLIGNVRRMALNLRPSMLDDKGLLPALIWLFKDYQSHCGEAVSFEQTGLGKRFLPRVENAVYRIIQEALTNVLRHAGNKKVKVTIKVDEIYIHLQIQDFGVGFNPDLSLSKGISSGLSGMRERTLLLDGEINIQSAPGEGTTITARLPLAQIQKGSK